MSLRQYDGDERATLSPKPDGHVAGRLPLRAVSATAEVLALQRSIGNRAVGMLIAGTGRSLLRYSLKGPWNKSDPVHEVLALRAIKDALEEIKTKSAAPGTLLRGVNTTGIPALTSKKGPQPFAGKDRLVCAASSAV